MLLGPLQALCAILKQKNIYKNIMISYQCAMVISY